MMIHDAPQTAANVIIYEFYQLTAAAYWMLPMVTSVTLMGSCGEMAKNHATHSSAAMTMPQHGEILYNCVEINLMAVINIAH